MPPALTVRVALGVWGISRVGTNLAPAQRGLQAASLLEQTPKTIKKRYRQLARAWHPDKKAAATGGGGGDGSDDEEQEPPDLHWLSKARDLLLEKLEEEQERDRQRLAQAQRADEQRQLAAADNFLAQLADRRQECSKQWGVPAAGLHLRFGRQERQVGQGWCSYLCVTLSGGGRSATALVTRSGFLLDSPCDASDHLPPGQAFAHELLSLQQVCNARGWRVQQAGGGSLSVRFGGHHSTVVSAQQLASGTATVAVLQAALDAEPALPARAARTAGAAGSAPAPAPATAARRDRGLGSTASQPAPAAAAAAAAPKRRPVPTAAQRMMQASGVPGAATGAGERQLIKEVEVGSTFLSHANFSISYKTDVPKLLGEDWDGQAATLGAEDTKGRRYELRIKAHTELVKQKKYQATKYRMCFSRALLQDNQARLGQRLQIWHTAGGGLQLQFVDAAAEPSGSGGAFQQHSTGSKRARRE